MRDFLQVITNGLIAGSTVALLAVSYSLVYSVLRFINFTFGEVLMFSAYVFYALKVRIGLSTWAAGLAAIILVGLLAGVIQIGAYSPFYRKSRLACLITALGVSIVLQNVALMCFTGNPLSIQSQMPVHVFRPYGIAVTSAQIVVFMTACISLVVLQIVVSDSFFGLRVRALADNLTMAELIGVSVHRTIGAVFVLGSCFAALVGILLSFETVLKPTMGVSPGIQAFAACVAGGIGSIRGAVVAALIISIAGNFVVFWVPSLAPETTAYAVLILALALFPKGIAEWNATAMKSLFSRHPGSSQNDLEEMK